MMLSIYTRITATLASKNWKNIDVSTLGWVNFSLGKVDVNFWDHALVSYLNPSNA